MRKRTPALGGFWCEAARMARFSSTMPGVSPQFCLAVLSPRGDPLRSVIGPDSVPASVTPAITILTAYFLSSHGRTHLGEVVGGEGQQVCRVADGRGPAGADERHDVGRLLAKPGQQDAR